MLQVKDHNIVNTYYKAISNLCFINNTYLIFLIKLKLHTRYESTCS